MKSSLSQSIIGLIIFLGLVPIASGADAPPSSTKKEIHHFSIIAPATAKVGEAIDVTVEARDKNDAVITDYRGSVFFQSETDFGATIPAQGRAIQFKESDNGVLKISKGVTFKRVGNQELSVSETLEDANGSIKIRVEENAGTTGSGSSESITITTPEKGSTVTSDNVMMSGKTKKNSKVIIKLNGKEVGTVQSNEDGIFTYKLSGIDQQSNIVNVSVYDGSNALLASTDSSFTYGVKLPTFYTLSIAPAKEVDGGTSMLFIIDAEPALSEVTVSLDGTVTKGQELTPGKYSINLVSPLKAGSYPVEVKLKNILSQVTTKSNIDTITVKAPVVVVAKPAFRSVKLTSEGPRINMNFFVDNLPESVTAFKIAYGETPTNLSEEKTTFTLDKIRQADGSYNWYMDNLPPKTYTFKIFAVQSGGLILPDFSSDPQNATVGKSSCSIGNVSDISVLTTKETSTLSWASLSGAQSYNIYRKKSTGDYELIKNVTETKYVLYINSGALMYEDFAVKALCDDTTESAVPAEASQVQTGPGIIAILIALSGLLAIFFIRKKWSYT